MENNTTQTGIKIVKDLKFARFIYDDGNKSFKLINVTNGETITLNKTYAFAFMRFLIRISSRNWFRKQRKIIKGVINK